jgi:hypothetical protein
MKKRAGFVSNSSSSSFLIIGDTGFPYDEVELTKEQKERVRKQGYDIPLDQKVRLTCYVSDCMEWDFMYDSSGKKLCAFIDYKDGGHGYPYDRDSYEEIAEDVWLYKEEDEENEN